MSIRTPQAPYAKPLPMQRGQDELPPFWELEDLIASGLDGDAALAVLALRRERRERSRTRSLPPDLSEPALPASVDDLSDIVF
ncbi:hypothetical protein DWF00_01320 [Bosea caraganae]|uniref:Uncharacterized protein n=1 Tax=Bosea caraganae TaxID=2763117 RepID=A0A370L9A1_9HYPH|nr:hypothetical protein [Bosea caraganae]RDJ26847.1 hypothetical protein DWE98_08340 [Bosea caraganae]RDJ30733.1 hypothetical protein DWF00_01320 [Bosea caraganae]